MAINVFNGQLIGRRSADLGEFEKQYQGRFDRAIQRGFGKLDSIHMTLPELEKMCGILENMETPSADLLENPALPEFELVVTEPFPSMRKSRVRFKRTLLPKVEIAETEKGCSLVYTPQIDAFVSQDNNEDVVSYLSLYAGHFYKDGEKSDITCTMQTFHYADPEMRDELIEDVEVYVYNLEAARFTKMAYLAIQEMLIHKPTVFVESKPTTTHTVQTGNGSNSKKNKVHVVKVIRLNAEELEKAIKGHKEIKCPCWGVMGHYRNYKSGKKVWIKPYKKGKERSNPGAYVAKEYLMEV